MATPIVRIKITETDLTTAAVADNSLDVVYIPGLLGIKAIATSTLDPNEELRTSKDFVVGDIFVDVEAKEVWRCKVAYSAGGSEAEPAVAAVNAEFELIRDKSSYAAPIITEPVAGDFEMIDPQMCKSTTDLEKFGFFYDNGEMGNSIDYAKTLIEEGLPVLYHCGVKFSDKGTYFLNVAEASDLIDEMKATLETSCFYALSDLNDSDVKYITTGAHPPIDVTEEDNAVTYSLLTDIVDNMVTVASSRGDAFALIDCAPAESVKEEGESLFSLLTTAYEDGGVPNGTYATAFAPCAHFNITGKRDVVLPGSFAYLVNFAKSIRTNGSNLAIAGVTRGLVSNLTSLDIPATERLTNAVADSWQDADALICVNGITYIRNYGYCIWGNRTLHNNSEKGGLTDSSFLSIRNMLCDLKKRLRTVAYGLLFEQNNDVLWSKFLFGTYPILDRLKSTAGIANYKVIRVPTNDKTKLKAVIRITTVKPLEQIEIGIVMVDDDVNIQ